MDLLALHRLNPGRYPFLLESAAAGTSQGCFDVLLACPGDALVLDSDGLLQGPGSERAEGSFLRALDVWWRREQSPPTRCGLPFRGGWFVYLGYELAAEIEPVLRLPRGARMPRALAVRIPAALIRNRATGALTAIAEAERGALLEVLAADARGAASGAPSSDQAVLSGPLQEDEPARYLAAVERARRYILDGDIFQANLARGWRGELAAESTPGEIYRRLRAANPGPFAGLALWREHAIISSSPERLVSVRGATLTARPIAGTRPRRAEPKADRALLDELIAHPKERAEHVMLVDLVRNDLGRLCEPGSVAVDELMTLESYARVHHIVSNVAGRLRPGAAPGEIVRAVFPGGTITGCPKVRCMQIIAELEGVAREAYTGSMGYLNRDGDLDFNILIRTLTCARGQLEFRAGAGIVADSVPERELAETRAKADALITALQGE